MRETREDRRLCDSLFISTSPDCLNRAAVSELSCFLPTQPAMEEFHASLRTLLEDLGRKMDDGFEELTAICKSTMHHDLNPATRDLPGAPPSLLSPPATSLELPIGIQHSTTRAPFCPEIAIGYKPLQLGSSGKPRELRSLDIIWSITGDSWEVIWQWREWIAMKAIATLLIVHTVSSEYILEGITSLSPELADTSASLNYAVLCLLDSFIAAALAGQLSNLRLGIGFPEG